MAGSGSPNPEEPLFLSHLDHLDHLAPPWQGGRDGGPAGGPETASPNGKIGITIYVDAPYAFGMLHCRLRAQNADKECQQRVPIAPLCMWHPLGPRRASGEPSDRLFRHNHLFYRALRLQTSFSASFSHRMPPQNATCAPLVWHSVFWAPAGCPGADRSEADETAKREESPSAPGSTRNPPRSPALSCRL